MRKSILEWTRFEDEPGHPQLDPVQFAWSVRQFAFDAQRILNDPFATARDLVELSGRIDLLWRHCPARSASGMGHWLRGARVAIQEMEVERSNRR